MYYIYPITAESPLLRLPPEIRNRIYELALTEAERMRLNDGEPALARTCRDVRADCLLIYYHVHDFQLDISLGAIDRALAIMSSEAGRRKMRAIATPLIARDEPTYKSVGWPKLIINYEYTRVKDGVKLAVAEKDKRLQLFGLLAEAGFRGGDVMLFATGKAREKFLTAAWENVYKNALQEYQSKLVREWREVLEGVGRTEDGEEAAEDIAEMMG